MLQGTKVLQFFTKMTEEMLVVKDLCCQPLSGQTAASVSTDYVLLQYCVLSILYVRWIGSCLMCVHCAHTSIHTLICVL